MGSKNSKENPQNLVILHQFPRGLHAPLRILTENMNLLRTYIHSNQTFKISAKALSIYLRLRMTNIEYKNEFGYKFSEHSLMPWIEFNGKSIPDSQIIIEHLSKHFNIDLNNHLTDEQKAISRAVLKLTEESLRWVGLIDRIVINPEQNKVGLPRLILFVLKPRTKKRAYAQGYGRFSNEQLYDIGRADCKAINDIIGKNKFLFGDKVCDTDAAVFGLLSQAVYHSQGPLNVYIKESCPNILRFVKNIKETYWSDWNSCVKEPINV